MNPLILASQSDISTRENYVFYCSSLVSVVNCLFIYLTSKGRLVERNICLYFKFIITSLSYLIRIL